jgi:hypothetical protein
MMMFGAVPMVRLPFPFAMLQLCLELVFFRQGFYYISFQPTKIWIHHFSTKVLEPAIQSIQPENEPS